MFDPSTADDLPLFNRLTVVDVVDRWCAMVDEETCAHTGRQVRPATRPTLARSLVRSPAELPDSATGSE